VTCYCSYHLGFVCVLLELESSCLVCGYIIGALLLSICRFYSVNCNHGNFSILKKISTLVACQQLLIVDPKKRLGCGNQGITAIKGHSWFDSTDWDALLEGGVEVPSEIIRRLEYALDVHPTDDTYQVFDLRPDEDDPPWLEGW
jgi:hypothetical protein